MAEKKRSLLGIIFGIILDIVIVLLVIVAGAFGYFKIVYTEANVVGQSMYPTLNSEKTDTDAVLVNTKASYARGDIVTVQTDKLDTEGNPMVIVKRIVAVAGDYVDIALDVDGEAIVLINKQKMEEPYINNAVSKEGSGLLVPKSYTQWLAYKAEHLADYDAVNGGILIGENQFFVMGDNRYNSEDSTAFGPINKEQIKGKVDYAYAKEKVSFIEFLRLVILDIGYKLKLTENNVRVK